MRRFPNLNGIRAFESAARFESFAKAAAEMHVTQAAVSRHVRNLEQELGFALFERGHRSIGLTTEGRAYAERVSEGLSIIAGRGHRGVGERAGKVVIEVDSDLMVTWLLPRVTQAVLSELGVELDLRSRLEWPRLLPTGTDLALVWGGHESPGFRSAPFLDTRCFVVSAPVLQDGRKPPAGPSEFLSYPLIHERGDGWWRRILSAAGLPAVDAPQNLYLHRTYLVAQAAARGLGLAVGDDIIFADDMQAGRVLQLPGPVLPGNRLYFLLEPSGRRVLPGVRRVRDWLVAQADAHRQWQASAIVGRAPLQT